MSGTIAKPEPRPAPKRAGTTAVKGKKTARVVRDAASPKSAKGTNRRPPVKAFRTLLRTAPLAERIRIEREGVPSRVVKALIDQIGVSSTDFQGYVGIPKATFTKKMREQQQFAGATGQSVVGFMDLINRVEDMLAAEQDNPGSAGFDVEKWVGSWIQRSQPALGGMAPAELMDTPSGRESVMRVLGAIQSGAYQ